jgi:hypothetical protein
MGPDLISMAQNYVEKSKTLILVGESGVVHDVGDLFNAAAATAKNELAAQGKDAVIVKVYDLKSVNNALNNNGSLNGVIYFGHGGPNALYVGNAPGANITVDNVKQLSTSKLTPNATITLNACNTGNWMKDSIAQAFANQLQRTAYGSSHPVLFSSSRTSYSTGEFKGKGPVYMVPQGGWMIQFSPERRD